MKIIYIFCLLSFLGLINVQNSFEMPPLHGGIVKKTNNTFLEIVREKERTNIYITGHDHKTITDKQLSISAIIQVKGKQYPVKLSFENDHYSTDPANSYLHKEKNFVLMLTISFAGNVDSGSYSVTAP